jgi:hypothetical protein
MKFCFFVTFDSKPVQLCRIRIQPGQKDSDLNGSGFGSTTRPVTRHNINLKNIALHTGQQAVPRHFGHSVHLCCDVSIPEHKSQNLQAITSFPKVFLLDHWPLLKIAGLIPLEGVKVPSLRGFLKY